MPYYALGAVVVLGAKLDGECTVLGSEMGSKTTGNEDRHVCVHSIPVIYGLVLELYKGLAEHILIELNMRLKTHRIEDKSSIQNDIHLLSIAARKVQKVDSIYKMLEGFSIGTDCTKKVLGILIQ